MRRWNAAQTKHADLQRSIKLWPNVHTVYQKYFSPPETFCNERCSWSSSAISTIILDFFVLECLSTTLGTIEELESQIGWIYVPKRFHLRTYMRRKSSLAIAYTMYNILHNESHTSYVCIVYVGIMYWVLPKYIPMYRSYCRPTHLLFKFRIFGFAGSNQKNLTYLHQSTLQVL